MTQFTVKAHAIGEVWGGIRAYSDLQRTELYAALHNFVPNGVDDPKAAIIFTDIIALADIPVIIVFYCYDGDTAPTSGPFADFLSISYLIDSTSTQAYSDILSTNGDESALLEARISFRVYFLTSSYSEQTNELHRPLQSPMSPVILEFISRSTISTTPLPFPTLPTRSTFSCNAVSTSNRSHHSSALIAKQRVVTQWGSRRLTQIASFSNLNAHGRMLQKTN